MKTNDAFPRIPGGLLAVWLVVFLAATLQAQNAAPQLVDDSVMVSNSAATLYPLANDADPEGDVLSISSVSDPAVSIQGRRLIIGTNVGESFTYQATDGTNTSTATVTVQRMPALLNSRRFTGFLYGTDGTIAGRVKLVDTRRGSASLELLMGTRRMAGRVVFGQRGGQIRTALGTLALTRKSDGTLGAALGQITGVLRACPNAAATELHHIALTTIGNLLPPPVPAEGEPPASTRIPGGGYMIVRLSRNATVTVSGRLLDGCPFTVGAFITDHKTIPLYFSQNTRTAARGVVAGQLLRVALPLTDVTGEFVWSKPPQGLNTPYPNRNGIETVLLANGCLHSATTLAGPATLRLDGGDLATEENNAATVSANRPNRVGSVVEWVPKPYGTFLVKLRFATGNPILGAGIYLPKMKRAWGYFPGEEQGGRVDLQLSTVTATEASP